MTMVIVFKKDHEQYKKGEMSYVERTLAIKLIDKEIAITRKQHLDNEFDIEWKQKQEAKEKAEAKKISDNKKAEAKRKAQDEKDAKREQEEKKKRELLKDKAKSMSKTAVSKKTKERSVKK